MALTEDFLKQSISLARRRGRPSQINLRRATSAAYYALFHLLIREAVDRMIAAQPAGLRARAMRSFQHGEVKEVCMAFQHAIPPKKLAPLLGSSISHELREISKAFLELQEERHAADYDISIKLSQSAVLSSVAKAETSFVLWRSICATDEATVFLAALIFGRRWDR